MILQDKSPFDLNVVACRLVLNILPALELSVLTNTDSLMMRLANWTENAKEPLQSYATGILAASAIEVNASYPDVELRCVRNDIPVLFPDF